MQMHSMFLVSNILAGKQPLDADLLPCLNTLTKQSKTRLSHAD